MQLIHFGSESFIGASFWGILLTSVSSNEKNIRYAYYQDLYSYILSKGFKYVVLNFGNPVEITGAGGSWRPLNDVSRYLDASFRSLCNDLLFGW